MNPLLIGLIVLGALVALVVFAVFAQFFNLWLQALLSGARVSFFDLIGMRLRKVNPQVIVISRIKAVKAGLHISTNDMEAHYLAGGRVPAVVNALIAADRARI
ncbi:MAG: UPF0365 family protein, partial [Planctomycetota bacterium]